jgi:3-oxoacyl-[acyl-carrier protein] reductase
MILITGASQGIGYECAKAVLARTTSDVMITGRDLARLRQARDRLPESMHARLVARQCDQGNAADIRALAAQLADPGTSLEGAILCVGTNPMYLEGPRRLHALSPETTEATIRTNCTHTMTLSGVILKRFMRQRQGVLIWIGSQAYKAGLPGAALYCATKAFLSGLVRTAHREYALRGVRMHLVNPGLVRTPRTAAVIDAFADRHGLTVDGADRVAERIVGLFMAGEPDLLEVDL